MGENTLKNLLIMTAILLLAACLRIYQLDTIPNGLKPDEAIRGYDAYSLARTGADSFGVRFPLFLRSFDDYTPALYSYLSIPFIAIYDLSVFSTRLVSAFIGIFSVAFAYQLIRRSFDQTAALVGSFLLAVSPWHILASRTGTEWNLLALGPVLTITLAYRGLSRPLFLIAAGIAGGISLYGYAPIKAFLPILLVGFVAFYWRELYQQKKAALFALLAFTLISIPIYVFSFTPEGLNRLNNVYQGKEASLLELISILIHNYFSYFSPDFLFAINYKGIEGRSAVALSHLRAVGLLYWFELPLILLGLIRIFFLRRKSSWFILYWLIAAPIGINLHSNSPVPPLWLTAIPIPQALAGAGFAWLLSLVKRPQIELTLLQQSFLIQLRRPVIIGLFVGLSLGILVHFGFMVHDLFYKFPIYGAGVWFYGRGPAILAMESLKNQYDDVNLASEDLSSSAYLLFYTRYDPAKRQAELARDPQQTWQNIGNYNIGNVRAHIQRPGCHLIMTSVADGQDLKAHFPHLATLRSIHLPDGKPVYGLYALPSPSTNRIKNGTIFGDKLLLQGFAPVSPAGPDVNLRPGQAICLILQWQTLKDITTDYTVFAHLTGPFNPATNSPLWAQHDSPPAYGAKLTSTWRAGDVIQDPHILTTPSNLPPGQYSLEIGLYNSVTGERLPIQAEDGSAEDKVILMAWDLPAG